MGVFYYGRYYIYYMQPLYQDSACIPSDVTHQSVNGTKYELIMTKSYQFVCRIDAQCPTASVLHHHISSFNLSQTLC